MTNKQNIKLTIIMLILSKKLNEKLLNICAVPLKDNMTKFDSKIDMKSIPLRETCSK